MDELSEEERKRRRQEYWALIGSVLDSAETVEELRNLTEDQVMARYAECLRLVAIATAPDDKGHFLNHARSYTDELTRREMERQGKRMEALTRSMHILTWVGVAVAVVGVVLTAITLLSGT